MPYLVQQTVEFADWHAALRDVRAKVAIARRMERAGAGNTGDVKPLGNGLPELRVDIGAVTGLPHHAQTGDRGAAVRRRQAHAAG